MNIVKFTQLYENNPKSMTLNEYVQIKIVILLLFFT